MGLIRCILWIDLFKNTVNENTVRLQTAAVQQRPDRMSFVMTVIYFLYRQNNCHLYAAHASCGNGLHSLCPLRAILSYRSFSYACDVRNVNSGCVLESRLCYSTKQEN